MTPEQKQRIEQIREHLAQRKAETRPLPSTEIYIAHVDFLLSLVKSQEADSLRVSTAPAVIWVSDPYGGINRDSTVHEHKHYDDDVRYLREDVFNSNYEDLLRAALLREQDATTSMRSACVGKVKAMADEVQRLSRVNFDDASKIAHHLRKAASALESVSIQEQEK